MTVRRAAAALALIFLVGHLFFLPPALEDIDSENFALGIRHFDIAHHQPHAPGYPVFMALAKLSNAVLGVVPSEAADTVRREAHALSLWNVLFGALAAFPLLQFFRCLELDDRRAVAATALTLASPLYWFTAARPMSDAAGLAAGLAALALLATAFLRQHPQAELDSGQAVGSGVAREIASGRMLVAGALASGLAIGFRSQNAWMVLPVLVLVLFDRIGRGAAGALLGTAMTFSIGVIVWLVPLLIATGGFDAYWGIVRAQAVEDFSGVDMLIVNPTPRRMALGLVQTFIYPWSDTRLAVVILVLATVGIIAMAARARRGLLLLMTGVGFYGLFHLLIHETVTVRYALPIVPAVAYLAVRGTDAMSRRAMPWATGALVGLSLAIAVPAEIAYAREPSPVFRAIRDTEARFASAAGDRWALAMHQVFRRAVETEVVPGAHVLPGPPMREWLELVAYWKGGGTAPVWFLADPRRTDLALIDPASRSLEGRYRWGFTRLPLMSGVRPDLVDVVRIDSPPAWFCGEGWHLTPETLGMSERAPRHDAVAFIRPRSEPSILFIGGQSFAKPNDPGLMVTVAIDGQPVDTWTSGAGFFFRKVRLPAIASVEPDGFARLVVSYELADRSRRPVQVRLTQFELQPERRPTYVRTLGWHEPEYDMVTDREWRWMADRADTVVHSAGHDLILTMRGESPLRYFDSAPRVIVRAGSNVLTSATPAADFEITARVPAASLEAAGGILTIETDRVFVPAERSSLTRDRRRLGLRIFSFDLKPAS